MYKWVKDKEFFMRKSKVYIIKNIIYKHILNNKKEYILISLIFILGIFLGVMFINNINENEIKNITGYFSKFIDTLKNTENIANMQMLRNTISSNIFIAMLLWFFGTTVIRNTCCAWNHII